MILMGSCGCVFMLLAAALLCSLSIPFGYAFAPPLITGETVINEGATLNLICNASNSYPLPRVQWFNPDGEMVGDGGFLNIVNIHRNMGGVYTCVASQNSATTSSTISVTVNVPFHCVALVSTDTITVNVNSTVVGSNATYHCRHDLSDIRTTQCTSDRVWDPDPNTIINCLKPECTGVQDRATWIYYVVMVTIIVITVVMALVLVGLHLLHLKQTKMSPTQCHNDLEDPIYDYCTPPQCLVYDSPELIDVSENACYETVQIKGRDHCHMDVNVAYGTTRNTVMIQGH